MENEDDLGMTENEIMAYMSKCYIRHIKHEIKKCNSEIKILKARKRREEKELKKHES